MTRQSMWLLLLSPGWAAAGDPDFDAVARRAWVITDLVAAHHVQPPSRLEMLTRGATHLFLRAESPLPDDLRTRLRTVTDADGLAAVLRSAWPAGGSADEFLQGLLRLRPGGTQPDGGDFLQSAVDLKLREQIAQNRYVGTGIQIQPHDSGYTQIVLAFPSGPARRAGVRGGDLIVAVNGADMKGKSMIQLVDALRGDEGTDVTMTVRRPEADEAKALTMTRAVVPFNTVLGYRRTGESDWRYRPDPAQPIGYVRLGSLNVSTLHDLRRVERQLAADGCRAVVLDLRQCVAGELHHVALVADGLIDGGVLWRVRGAQGRVTEQRADRDELFRGWPMVALIAETTAGAGMNALTAALQDRKRATLVGQPTPRAGVVRSLVPLPDDGGALIVTTGFLDRPTGQTEKYWRVEPDHAVEMTSDQLKAIGMWQRAQENPDSADAGQASPTDPPLAKALELLRAALPQGVP